MTSFAKLPGRGQLEVPVKQTIEILREGNEHTRVARQEIDDSISKLEHEIRILKKMRNKLSPVAVLPPEILSRIFILIRDSFVSPQQPGHEADWIYVGHVCHHWREIALGFPSLWSIPVFTKPGLVPEMIRRSKPAPLAIVSNAATWSPRMLEELENAMGQIARIQSIEFTVTSYSEQMKIILSSLSRPAPLLQEITLWDTTYRTHSLPVDALSDAPNLRVVNFDRLSWSWESAIFRNTSLTTLRLKDNRADAIDKTFTITQLINTLKHLPNLRVFELSNSIPLLIRSSEDEATLEFKHLEELTLADEAIDCIAFLRRIRYPSHTIIKLCSSATEVEDCLTIFSIIGKNLYKPQAGNVHSLPTIRSAWLTSVSHTADFYFSDKPEKTTLMDSYDSDTNPIAHIQFSGSHALDQERDRLFKAVYDYFDLSSLEGLSLFWASCNEETRNCLGRLPKLECIRMSVACLNICFVTIKTPESNAPIEQLATIKSHHFPHKGDRKETFLPVTTFPALKTLVIEGGDFSLHRYQNQMEYFIESLATRSNMNVPVNRLRLEGCCGVADSVRKRLKELVVHLEVEESIRLKRASQDFSQDEGGEGSEEDDFSDD